MSNIQFKAQSFNTEYFKECDRAGWTHLSRPEQTLFHVGSVWYNQRRPFFNVYPGVERCLSNTRSIIDPASIPQSVLHELGVMEVRFASSSSTNSYFMAILPVKVANDLPVKALCLMRIDERGIQQSISRFGLTIKDDICPRTDHGWLGETDGTDEIAHRIRLSIGVMLLAADPRYCEPVLLNRDRDRLMNDTERQQALERAKKRGNFGFDLGKDVEVSPHFRRPHFAIRWTGKGSAIPRLVPVKGAIINEGLITNVPTGYEDAERCEVIDSGS